VTKYVALYARLSPRPDGSYEGCDLQEQWGKRYAANTWPGLPVRVFSDPGISAANGDHRPKFEELRAALGRGEVAHLWTVEQTRLERTEVGWFRLAAELDAAGVTELHTNRDGVVRVLDEVSGIKAVLAAGEVRKLKRRVNDRLDELAAEGRPSGAQQFGYRRALGDDGRKTLVLHELEAAVVREAAERILAGWSLTRIATDFANRGLTGVRGGKFTGQTLRSFLTAPAVAGLRVHRGRIVGRGVWPAIIDEATWNAVRDRLAAPRVVERSDGGTYVVRKDKRSSARKYLLTGGLSFCGVCDAPLKCSIKQLKAGREQPYYLCVPAAGGRGCVGIMGPQLEEHVKDELLNELDKPEFIAALAADEHEARRDELNAALRKVDQKRRKLAKDWAADELTDDEWREARATLDAKEGRLRSELASVPPPVSHIDPALIREGWAAMNLDERREIVRMFVERVIVKRAVPGRRGFDKERVAIVWRRR
jgi:site-specific DNA recombinase